MHAFRFALEDGMQFMKLAAQALCQDEFSKCFEPKPVKRDPTVSFTYGFYLFGAFIRYCILFPLRLSILAVGSIVFACCLPAVIISGNSELGHHLFLWYCKIWLLAISAIVRHHGNKPSLRTPHIFVANHTSYIDFFLMSAHKFPQATIAQVHGGLFGWLQRHVLRLNGSLFFYRDESRDREKLASKMKSHTEDLTKSPLIIFPEGTCVNNEYTVLFHKGAFELGCAVCPVAIKYNKRLFDPYWNTREQTFTQHLLYLMTRWIIVADVWWLPPESIRPGESSIEFANRVKHHISKAAGLKNLSWNGYLKNYVRQQDRERLRSASQMKYGTSLRKKLPQLIGEDVKLETEESSVRDTILARSIDIRTGRYIGHHNPLEVELGSTITDLKNELLMGSPSKSRKEVQAEPLLEQISDTKQRMAHSWKTQSILSQLAEEEGQETRLDYSGWRMWSKHKKNTQ